MRPYESPGMEIIELRPEERLARSSAGTIGNDPSKDFAYTFLNTDADSSTFEVLFAANTKTKNSLSTFGSYTLDSANEWLSRAKQFLGL